MKVVFICLSLLASPLFAVAGPLDEALKAYKEKDYQVAFKKFSQVANGSESADMFLAKAGNKNPGVSKQKLEDYWRENYGPSAKRDAQFYLGVMHSKGLGVTQSYSEAFRMYVKASLAGDADAQLNLALMYCQGRGINQDFAQAVYWYTQAAEHGNTQAMNNLGYMYDYGQGTPQNYILAHHWYNLAAARAEDPEDHSLAMKNRDNIARKMTPSQIAEAQHLASQWKIKD